MHLIVAATIFLVLFVIVGSIDGMYFHLRKYKLYLHKESLYEHKLHTARAILFLPIVFFLFFANFGGIALWAGILFLLIDFVVEMLDVVCERQSRALMDGLSTAEYASHVVATTMRIAAFSLIIAAKPSGAWKLSALRIEPDYPRPVSLIALAIMISTLFGAIHHLRLTAKSSENRVPSKEP